jgi:YD repeat-containing protein
LLKASKPVAGLRDVGPVPLQGWVGIEGWRRVKWSSYAPRMTNPMAKILLALLTFPMMTGAASAQQRTFYDSSGKVVGRSSTDSQGTTTNYDSRGRVISRESTNGNQTTIYDASGRNVGRFTTNPQR